MDWDTITPSAGERGGGGVEGGVRGERELTEGKWRVSSTSLESGLCDEMSGCRDDKLYSERGRGREREEEKEREGGGEEEGEGEGGRGTERGRDCITEQRGTYLEREGLILWELNEQNWSSVMSGHSRSL